MGKASNIPLPNNRVPSQGGTVSTAASSPTVPMGSIEQRMAMWRDTHAEFFWLLQQMVEKGINGGVAADVAARLVATRN